MSTGTIIALAIILVAIIALVVVGFMSYRKAKPALENINDTKETINQKTEYFKRESEHITEKVNHINQRVESLQAEIDVKTEHFQDFADENGEFQTSVRYFKDHAPDYAKGISSNVRDEWKEEGPKIKETFKRAFKKTRDKQKARYQKQ